MPKTRRKVSKYASKIQEFEWKTPANERQWVFYDLMDNLDWVFASGPAGTGKNLMALQKGLQMMNAGEVDHIYYVRLDPNNSNDGGKALGSLPGSEKEKLDPLLGPIKDNLLELCSESKAKSLIDQDKIKAIPFEYLRGRSLTYSFIIVDESQNIPPKGILTALTRKGRGSKMVFIGDSMQKDSLMRYSDGFADAFKRLPHIDDIGFVEFKLEDVMRDKRLINIMKAYNYS